MTPADLAALALKAYNKDDEESAAYLALKRAERASAAAWRKFNKAAAELSGPRREGEGLWEWQSRCARERGDALESARQSVRAAMLAAECGAK